jgi:transposase
VTAATFSARSAGRSSGKFSTIGLIWADGGYTGRLVDWAQAVLAFTVTIVKCTDDPTGFQVIPRRWVVERTPAWISKHRRCVRDCETRPEHAGAMVYIAMIRTMSRLNPVMRRALRDAEAECCVASAWSSL